MHSISIYMPSVARGLMVMRYMNPLSVLLCMYMYVALIVTILSLCTATVLCTGSYVASEWSNIYDIHCTLGGPFCAQFAIGCNPRPLINHSTDVDTNPCMHDTQHIMLSHMEPSKLMTLYSLGYRLVLALQEHMVPKLHKRRIYNKVNTNQVNTIQLRDTSMQWVLLAYSTTVLCVYVYPCKSIQALLVAMEWLYIVQYERFLP